MLRKFENFLFVLILAIGGLVFAFIPLEAKAIIDTFAFDSISPPTDLRGGSVPPRPDTTLFVFEMGSGGYGTTYTAVFNVTEEPAAIVGTAVEITDVDYDAGAGQVRVTFKHVGYTSDLNLPGPSTDFALAFLKVGSVEQGGLPAQMRGSWMATNVSPLSWQLIPPSLSNPGFGYQISGPAGDRGFFHMFVPQSAINLLGQLYGQPLTLDSLAVFNDGSQASIDISPVQEDGNVTGGFIDVNVVFAADIDAFVADEAQSAVATSRLARSTAGTVVTEVAKSITLDRAKDVSIAASDTSVVRNTRVRVFGWVRGGRQGEKVKITARSSSFRKQLTLNSEGGYSFTYSAKATKKFRASFKRKGRATKYSDWLQVTATKR